MQERNLATVLLVRSVEEHAPGHFTADELSAAALAAAGAWSDADLIEKRSAFLFLRLPRAVQAWARIGMLPENALGVVVLLALFVGMAANFLGPAGQLHVVYNPLVFLIAWNVLAYALFAWRALAARPAEHSQGFRLAVRDVWWAWSRWTGRLAGGGLPNAARVAAAYRERYWQAAAPVVLARIEGLIHVGAIFLVLGAIGGTYARGLFLEYNAVWRSTFLTDPGGVATLLNLVLAPGLALADGRLLASADIEPLLSAGGAPAAPWIHRIAATAAVLVLAPRAVLALLAARATVRAERALRTDLAGDDYYAAGIRAARDSRIHALRQEIGSTVRTEIARLAESLALFVRERFFDRSVAPTLLQFRNRGGRIDALEAEIGAARAAFERELEAYLAEAKVSFESSLAAGLQKLVGRELAQAAPLGQEGPQPGTIALGEGIPGSIAVRVSDGVGASVVMTVSATAAMLSGGIGQNIGIAVVASLLGTSGPIGLLIGGLAALALAGGGYLLGRERIAAAVKRRHLPATLVALAMREAKIREAREATYAQVKREVAARLEPQVTELTEAILAPLASVADRPDPRTAPP